MSAYLFHHLHSDYVPEMVTNPYNTLSTNPHWHKQYRCPTSHYYSVEYLRHSTYHAYNPKHFVPEYHHKDKHRHY